MKWRTTLVVDVDAIRCALLPGTEGGNQLTTTSNEAIETPQFVAVHQNDPLASPLLDELTVEYSTRYGASDEEEYNDLRAYPPEEFDPPGGVLIVAVSNGVPVAGGAFRRYDASTAELKRMWTASGHRRRGYGQLVVAELERIALQRGYTRVYLTTGWRQPEAVALYLSMGYTPLFDPSLPADDIGVHPFEKHLVQSGASEATGVQI
jgi:GNAT superfamily N-acetyltransferase